MSMMTIMSEKFMGGVMGSKYAIQAEDGKTIDRIRVLIPSMSTYTLAVILASCVCSVLPSGSISGQGTLHVIELRNRLLENTTRAQEYHLATLLPGNCAFELTSRLCSRRLETQINTQTSWPVDEGANER
jgi:hypothetical protein